MNVLYFCFVFLNLNISGETVTLYLIWYFYNFQLNTLVDNICIVPGDEESEFPKWRLKTYNWDLKKHEESDFDGVVVCNGCVSQ